MDVYVCLFCVCVVLCVGNGLETGWSPFQWVLPTVYRFRKTEKQAKPQQKSFKRLIKKKIFTIHRSAPWTKNSLYAIKRKRFRNIRQTVHLECQCKTLFETPCIIENLGKPIGLVLRFWRWRRDIPSEHHLSTSGLQSVVSHKTELFIINKVRHFSLKTPSRCDGSLFFKGWTDLKKCGLPSNPSIVKFRFSCAQKIFLLDSPRGLR
jgi:hypothetical protein